MGHVTHPPAVPLLPLAQRAGELLRTLAGPDAVLRADQLTAITALVADRRRALVVQRTGWGKSAVYWIATSLLRQAGAGPTLVVSPLLALMRDQVEAASRMGLAAITLNSANVDDWPSLEAQIAADGVDVLLISPERLNNPGFRARVLPQLAARVGLLVVDEAHCIADWSHDFRPDYQRIRDVLAALPPGVPVLATTATANARVTADVADQIGADTITLRGSLDRDSLALSIVDLPDAAHRYAWLAEALPSLPGSGIVYCLTIAEAERLASYLALVGLAVAAYSSAVGPEQRQQIEANLKSGRLKAVAATSALGMGFDMPTLGFVAHLGSPSSPIAYYQQVGRAGRALEHAVAVLLPGKQDAKIWDYFTSTAMPAADIVEQVLGALAGAERPMSVPALETRTPLRRGRLETLLKILDVGGAVARTSEGWRCTGAPWVYDTARYAALAAARHNEQQAMRAYQSSTSCLMARLRAELDDPDPGPCGRCSACTGQHPGPAGGPTPDGVARALAFLRGIDVLIPARKMWPAGLAARRGAIPADVRAEQGRALALGTDAGWGEQVAATLAADRPIPDELLTGLVAVLARWDWDERPTWICPVPSRRRGALLTDLATRLGDLGRLPVVSALIRIQDTAFQETTGNSTAAARGALAALAVTGSVPAGPVLLLDDRTDSGWTLTVAAALLREAGAGRVHPLVLHRRP